MKINKKKLGFTLVELLVVIAILAVLATVAIIGYSSFINEAHKSNDNSVVTELNHYLKAANPLGEEVPTATDAAEKLEGCGLNIAELQPSAKDAYYGYNYKSSEFVYIEDIHDWQEDGHQVSAERKLTTFVFAKKEGQVAEAYENGYSVYLQKDYNGVTANYANADFKAVNGLDVGEASVTAVNYINTTSTAKDVVIRTNSASTLLTIDAAADTVKHYGAVGSLNIIAVANMSYHEYGQVAFAEIATGRIVLESDSEVEHIHLTATEGNFVDITVAKASDVEMPEFSRDPVEIPAEGKLVVALQDGTETTDDKDYVWLTAVGVYEQVTVSSSSTAAGNNYAANSNDQEKKDTAQQISNNISVTVGDETYTVKAEKTSTGWDYVLVDEDKQVSGEYSVSGAPVVNVSTDEETAITTTTVTVSVVDANEAPVTSATSAIENGSDKAEEKSKYVAELISNDAELREFLAGTKQKGKLANNVSNPTVETKSTRYVYANGRDVELDLAGFTLDGYEICVNDGSTLTLTGNGVVNLDGEEPIFITNGNLVIAGVTISGKIGGTSNSNKDSSYASGLVDFYHEGDQNITMNLIIADDTINYISVLDGEGSTTYKGNCADIIAIAYGEGTLTLNVVGQEKGNGILNMSTTGNSESYANGIREYAGGGHVDTIVRNCVLNISAARNLNNGYTNNFVLENIIGSVFSQDCSDYCISGYATIYSNSSAKYEFEQITEQNASIEVTNSDSTKFYAVNLGSAMRNVGNGGTIKLLKNVVYNGTIDDLTIDSFNIDLNSKTVTGSWGFFNPNETNYNVHDTVTVTISNGSIDGCLNLYHNTLIILDHIAFKNTSSTSYDRGLYLNTSISPTTYSWATIYSKIVANNCTFDNVRVEIYGGSGAQHVDVKFDGCTFTNNTASSYSAFAENYYIYGDVEFDDCSFDIRLSATYKYAVELGNNSSNGNNPVNLIVKDTVIIVRSNSYASHKPISGISATSTIFTVTENGTNSYKVVNNSNDTQFRMTDVYGTTLGE